MPDWLDRFMGFRYPPYDLVKNKWFVDRKPPPFKRGETLEHQKVHGSACRITAGILTCRPHQKVSQDLIVRKMDQVSFSRRMHEANNKFCNGVDVAEPSLRFGRCATESWHNRRVSLLTLFFTAMHDLSLRCLSGLQRSALIL
ncbi:hypothetical protein KCU78_g9, partial [Aureobasidium melanogenum]